MKKALFVALALSFGSALAVAAPPANQKPDYKAEVKAHPNIADAIKALDLAIDHMTKAPEDFGGNKAKALGDSKAARSSLRKALWYRVKVDSATDVAACEASVSAEYKGLCKEL